MIPLDAVGVGLCNHPKVHSKNDRDRSVLIAAEARGRPDDAFIDEKSPAGE
jgi:hypothetical protein